MSPILVIIAVLMLLYYIYSFMTTKPSSKFPPGPLRLPFVGGYLHLLLENSHFLFVALERLSERYKSPLVGLYFGDIPVVVANSHDTCRDVFLRPEFQGRADTLVTKTRARGDVRLGIFFDDGDQWLTQRRFSLRKMRDLGFGRRSDSLEAVLDEEVKDLVDELRHYAETGQPVLLPDAIYPVMVNCIYQVILGTRTSLVDRNKLKEFGSMLMKFQNGTDAFGRLVVIWPVLRHLFPRATGFRNMAQSAVQQWDFVRAHVEEHKATLDKEAIRDFMDAYLTEMSSDTAFTEDHLTMCAVDIIFPATAASAAIGFALMYVLEQPEVLDRCQQELDCVVGRGRLPTLADRQFLPYTEATLREVLRKQPIAPLGVPHRCTTNTEWLGFEIPQNTVLVSNIHAMHHDRAVWDDPDTFRPDRFLDRQGNLKKKDPSLPFGLGKRVCAGETFARQNMFVTLAAIFQNFNIQSSTVVDFSSIQSGLILNPAEHFFVKLSTRD